MYFYNFFLLSMGDFLYVHIYFEKVPYFNRILNFLTNLFQIYINKKIKKKIFNFSKL